MGARRRYRLGRRAVAASATRTRIVEATLGLHDAQGISATSVRDVAGAAGVAPSTVLQHFPRMEELIRACGELASRLAPMPGTEIFAGTSGVAERVERMATAMYEWWDQMGPGFDHLRIDRHRIPAVGAWMTEITERHRGLARAAAANASGPVDLLVALTTADAWRTMRDAGGSPAQSGARVARLIGPQMTQEQESEH